MTGAFSIVTAYMTWGNSACLNTNVAMLPYSHEITSKKDYYSLFFLSLHICTGWPESLSHSVPKAHGKGGGGGTLIFSYILRLGSFFGGSKF